MDIKSKKINGEILLGTIKMVIEQFWVQIALVDIIKITIELKKTNKEILYFMIRMVIELKSMKMETKGFMIKMDMKLLEISMEISLYTTRMETQLLLIPKLEFIENTLRKDYKFVKMKMVRYI